MSSKGCFVIFNFWTLLCLLLSKPTHTDNMLNGIPAMLNTMLADHQYTQETDVKICFNVF